MLLSTAIKSSILDLAGVYLDAFFQRLMFKGESRTQAAIQLELFMIIMAGLQLLSFVAKSLILDDTYGFLLYPFKCVVLRGETMLHKKIKTNLFVTN